MRMTGDVMLIHGINDSLVPYSYSEKALEESYTSEALFWFRYMESVLLMDLR